MQKENKAMEDETPIEAKYIEETKKPDPPRQWRHDEAMRALTDDPDKHWPEIYKAMQEGRIDKKVVSP